MGKRLMTVEDQLRIVDMHRAGHTDAEIAAAIGFSVSGTTRKRTVLIRRGLTTREAIDLSMAPSDDRRKSLVSAGADGEPMRPDVTPMMLALRALNGRGRIDKYAGAHYVGGHRVDVVAFLRAGAAAMRASGDTKSLNRMPRELVE